MLAEIELDNARGLLLPGAFSEVTFHIHSPPLPKIPAEALVLRKGEEYVALVENGRIRIASVKTGITDGKSIQVVSGLREGERVALNPPAELENGSAVRATERAAEAPDAGAAPAR
jgi:hypothetical protein